MSNFEKVKIFMKAFGQEVKEKAEFPGDKITSLRCDLILLSILNIIARLTKFENQCRLILIDRFFIFSFYCVLVYFFRR